MDHEFAYRDVPALKKRVHRLGLAFNYGLTPEEVAPALERGINYLYLKVRHDDKATAVRAPLGVRREQLVVAATTTMGYFGWMVRRAAERALRLLNTDYLDVFQLGWLGPGARWSPGTIEALCRLREEGKVRAIGASLHDRAWAGALARDSPLDLLMVRYNAAHPGAERDVFPHLSVRHPALVAYTATSWQQLLRRPPGWDGPLPSAGDCYRFCLSNSAVDVVLCGAGSLAQLDENLAALSKGPLRPEEMSWMRRLGDVVHGRSRIPGAPA